MFGVFYDTMSNIIIPDNSSRLCANVVNRIWFTSLPKNHSKFSRLRQQLGLLRDNKAVTSMLSIKKCDVRENKI